jgi:Protein of unknown function (DUF3486)
MPKRPEVDKLPAATVAKINTLIAQNAFGNYQELSEKLADEGVFLSGYQLKTHGAKLSQEMGAARREALLLAAMGQVGDESASLVDVVADIGLLRAAQALTAIDGIEEPIALSKLMSGSAALGKTSIEAKKWNLISKAEIERKLKKIEQDLKSGDLPKSPEEMIALIRAEVFGFSTLQNEMTINVEASV